MADSLKNSWKETGTGLGHAFRDLGKTLIKTGATAAKKADAWANGEEQQAPSAPAKSLSQSWKQTGVELGHAGRDLGKSIVKTGATAVKKADAWANGEDAPDNAAPQSDGEETPKEQV